MKKRGQSQSVPGGILRWSTFCILAGGAAGLTSCERNTHVATEKDVEMAAIQSRIETLDAEKSRLMDGEVSNNFHIPRVGYYHAQARDFFEHPYGFQQDGKFFVDGKWEASPGAEQVAATRPSKEALEKLDAALAEEQNRESSAQGGNGSGNHGFGMGNALMMYWLLAGNRGMFSGSGFRQANGQAGNWQRGVENQRSEVGRYASSNPGYQRMVQQSRATGKPVTPGQSVRGGFGSTRTGSGYSRGSGGGSSFGG